MKLPERGIDAGLDELRSEIGRLEGQFTEAAKENNTHIMYGITARQARLSKRLMAYIKMYRLSDPLNDAP